MSEMKVSDPMLNKHKHFVLATNLIKGQRAGRVTDTEYTTFSNGKESGEMLDFTSSTHRHHHNWSFYRVSDGEWKEAFHHCKALPPELSPAETMRLIFGS